MGREGWAAAIIGSVGQEWDVERRFRVTEVALAIMWVCKLRCGVSRVVLALGLFVVGDTNLIQCCASAYLSYFFADCMMSRWSVHPLTLDLLSFLFLTIAGF